MKNQKLNSVETCQYCQKLREQNERYRAALEFYAQPWIVGINVYNEYFTNENNPWKDCGIKAREALKEVDNKEF